MQSYAILFFTLIYNVGYNRNNHDDTNLKVTTTYGKINIYIV